MISIKPALWSRANKEGLHQLLIRVTKNRKYSVMFTGLFIPKKQWDTKNRAVKKGHPNAQHINALLAKKVAEANNAYLKLELQDQNVSAKLVTAQFKETHVPLSFFAVADSYLQNLQQEGKFNQWSADKPRVGRFRKFAKDKDLRFEDITVNFLRNFKAFLKGKHSVSERTAINYLIVIRTIFNRAIQSNIVEQKHYPFGKSKIQIKFPDSVKLGLSQEELEKLISHDLHELPEMSHARNVWLTSFYFAGMRISDVLKLRWSNIHDNRLHYSMGKNAKADSLKIPDQAMLIFNQYKDCNHTYGLIFPELETVRDMKDTFEVQKKTSVKVKVINEGLKHIAELIGIEKKLTTHIARHTFGNLSGDKIPIQMLQKLYRHTHVSTTINYQKSFIFKDADDALEKVINFQ